MKNKMPTAGNKNLIRKELADTFANRRNWIMKDCPTAAEIFNQYPQLKNFGGEMVKFVSCSQTFVKL